MGHRPQRDKRITTHVALVARAFGADGLILADVRDERVERSVRKVVELWGGDFFIQSGIPWRKAVDEWQAKGGMVVHLTMYGLPLDDVLPRLGGKDLLVAIGAEKVPGEIFELADLNVAVGNQPHSEVAALAILLDRIFRGTELKKQFDGAKLRIIPMKKGKNVQRLA